MESTGIHCHADQGCVFDGRRILNATDSAAAQGYCLSGRAQCRFHMLNECIKSRGVILRGRGLDEAPQASRRLPDVLVKQGDTIDEVLHTLAPLIVVMAGAREFDPYRD